MSCQLAAAAATIRANIATEPARDCAITPGRSAIVGEVFVASVKLLSAAKLLGGR